MARQQAPSPSGLETRGALRRRISALESLLHDLSQDQSRLREQIAEILDLVDRGGAPPAVLKPAAPPPSRGTAGFGRRALRFAVRSTLGLARRAWQTADPATIRSVRVELGRDAASLPSLGVVFDGHEALGPEVLETQTDRVEELIFWDRGAGTVEIRTPAAPGARGAEPRRGRAGDTAALRRAVTADYLVTASDAMEQLPATAFELTRLACAGEDLAFLEIPAGSHDAVRFVRRELWDPDDGFDARSMRRRPPRIGKSLSGGACGELVAVGRYRIARRHLPYRQRLQPLSGIETVPAGGPERVMVLLSSPLAGGLEQLTADLLRELGEKHRFLVVSLAASDGLQAARLRQLERITPAVYPLADVLPAELAASALGLLARRHRAATVLHLGNGDVPAQARASLRLVEPPKLCGVRMDPATGRDGSGLRQDLDIPAAAILVAMVSDLLARKRPEDFLALAHRMRDDDRYFFLLVGRGPLAGSVDDLERYLAPPRFRRLEAAPRADVLAAADVVCTTSEEEPLPYFLLTALAAGLPVAACAVDGLDRILAEGPCGAAVPVADLAGFEAVLLALADAEKRRAWGDNGRRLVERRFRLDDAMARYGEILERPVTAR